MKQFIITSLQHPLVKHLVKLRQDSHYRYQQQSVLIEGIKPIQELNTKIKKIICTESHAALSAQLGQEQWIVTEAIIHKISGLSTSEGILAEVQMPTFLNLQEMKCIMALDGINDPGNMGTLLRTALALGWDGTYLLPNCCDPFNEKAMRAARGAQFKMPLSKGSIQQLKDLVTAGHYPCYVADIKGIPPEKVASSSRKVLVLGNEAHGVTEEVRSFSQALTIPMPGEMESLNVAVAGGILLYLLRM